MMLLDGPRRLEGCCWLDRQERLAGNFDDGNNRNGGSDAAE